MLKIGSHFEIKNGRQTEAIKDGNNLIQVFGSPFYLSRPKIQIVLSFSTNSKL